MTTIKRPSFRAALTDEDYKLFFEALGEYGKDFQNIQQYMGQKGGQKSNNSSNNNNSTSANGGSNNNYNNNNASNSIYNNNNSNNNNTRLSEPGKPIDAQEKRELDKKEDDRKRDQIRKLYKLLFAKLSKLTGKIDDRVDKVTQELYLLINYGEIWKRHGFDGFNKRANLTKRLLEELVYQGTTTFKADKKNVRLRTPACKALKKINKIGIDDELKVVTTRELPKDVIVEFHPASARDWIRVQSISQNPRVRSRFSIQKRLTSVLMWLENKWNLSDDKLNRTVDMWLKVSTSSHQVSNDCAKPADGELSYANNNNDHQYNNEDSLNTLVQHDRLRLKPSYHHEFKEVNVTRVVPDNHLDLSLNAYIKRLETTQPKLETKRELDCPEALHHHNLQSQDAIAGERIESSSITNRSRLPVSLTTPDCSILLERSCTSDQPSIAQARKHLSILQSLTGGLEGCENSRTAYEDTQDRSLMNMLTNQNSRSVTFAPHEQHFTCHEPVQVMHSNPTILVNNKDIPALYDEDAALPVSSSARHTSHTDPLSFGINSNNSNHISMNLVNSDSQNSKSVDFQIPKNVTLGDYFKMSEPTPSDDGILCSAGDETANDAFPVDVIEKVDDEGDLKDVDRESEDHFSGLQTKDNNCATNGQVKLQNHAIEIKKFAEGWTRQDEPSITLGELYLAFKCPEKITLEYEFEQSEPNQQQYHQQSENLCNGASGIASHTNQHSNTMAHPEDPSNDRPLFKLLTVASLSQSLNERRKQEQLKPLESQQSCSKLKRRKGSGQGQMMTLHDIEATNQRVEEALKQLQPTRLSGFKRTR